MNRTPQLDLLRGIAVLGVIVSHYPILKIASAGWIGVDLFFVLSGFLISGLLYTEFKQRGTISVSRFLIRRGFKIYPGFYAFLAITALLLPKMFGTKLLHEALFVQNYTSHLWGHTWSLAVEEQFYLALPFLLLMLGRNRLHLLPLISCIAMVVCGSMRFGVGTLPNAENYQVAFPSHLRVDSLLAGVALSYCYL